MYTLVADAAGIVVEKVSLPGVQLAPGVPSEKAAMLAAVRKELPLEPRNSSEPSPGIGPYGGIVAFGIAAGL